MSRMLVIDTATAACSVAVIDHGRIVDRRHEVVGRGHAERVVPMIAELFEGGRADRILVDCGPGSFTGVRVGIAAARGLAIGWGVPVAGYSSLALIAAMAFAADPTFNGPLAVLLEGGHGEMFMQSFTSPPLSPVTPLASLAPDAARRVLGDVPAVGDGLRLLGSEDPRTATPGLLPDAVGAILLPASLVGLPPTPIYGRAPDARPPVVRG